jgi:glycosyltransferase involved in cell wall biosynthesis
MDVKLTIAQVVHRYNPYGGGVDKLVYLTAIGLRRIGHKVTILTSDVAKSNGEIITFRGYFYRMTPGLLNHLVKTDYDIVHVHGYNTFQPTICVFAKLLKNFSVVFTPHFHPVGEHPPVLRKIFDIICGRFCFKNVNVVVAVTPIEMQMLAEFVKSIVFVPNMIDDIYFTPRKISDFKARWNLKEKVVLFVGRLNSNKGLPILLRAFNRIKNVENDVSLLIVGPDVNMLSHLKRLVADLRLDSVVFTGELSINELLEAYDNADVFVLPSSYEAFGMVLLEAQARNVPVIATNVGGMPYIIKDNLTGILVPYGDDNVLATKIIDMLTNTELREKLITTARTYVEKFRINTVAKMLEKVYLDYG